MSKYIRFQLISLLRTPTIYLIVLVITPILYLLSSSFIPAYFVLPGILIFQICLLTLFCIGVRMYQTDSTTFIKRLNVVGISKTRVIFANLFIAVGISIFATYLFLETFSTLTMFLNWELTQLDTTRMYEGATFTPEGIQIQENFNNLTKNGSFIFATEFNWFFANDIFSVLGDSTYLMVIDVLDRLLLQTTFGNVDDLLVLVSHLLNSIKTHLENLYSNNPIAIGYAIELIESVLDDVYTWEGTLNEALVIIDQKLNEWREPILLGGHAPVNFIVLLLEIPTSINSTDGGGFWYENEIFTLTSTRSYYLDICNDEFFDSHNEQSDYYGGQTRIWMHYSRFAPTLSSTINDTVDYNSVIFPTNDIYRDTPYIRVWIMWVESFLIFVIVSISIFSITLLINSLSKTFEQYMTFSGLVGLIITLFSGLFVPYTWFLGSEVLFSVLIFFPTTMPLIQLSAFANASFESITLIEEQALLSTFVFPLVISALFIFLSYKFLEVENKKLVKHRDNDSFVKRSSITNIVFASIYLIIVYSLLLFLLFGRSRYLSSDSNILNSYPSNELVFVMQVIMLIYVAILFVNIIDFRNQSITLLNNRWIVALLNIVFLFPIALITMPINLIGKRINVQEQSN